ncbi:MAG: ABC transporter permease [Acidobacteriaceae bacterium]
MWNDLNFRLRALFRRKAMESELNEELSFHFEHEIEKYRQAGMSEEEAIRQARLVFGGQTQIKEDCREARGVHLLETTVQDVHYGFRAMRKNPGFFAIATLTLALGIGASVAVFSLVNTILLKPLPYPNADRVLMLWREGPLAGIGDMPWAPQEYNALTSAQVTFQKISAFRKDSFNLTGLGNPQLLEGVRASGGFFPTLGVSPLLGRTFTAEEDQPGHDHVAILSYALWRTRFGGDRGIVGRTIDLNGSPYSVIGVMPASFTFPNQEGIPSLLDLPKETQLWVPLALPSGAKGENNLGVIGLLPANYGIGRVQQDMAVVEKRLEEQIPQEKGWYSRAVPLMQQTVTDTRRPLLLLFGAVSVVLLISCANVAGLLLNRALGRRREITLRAALGAGRVRLIRQLMTESLLLALAGGAIGILLGELGLYLARHFGPESIPHLRETGLNLNVIAYTCGVMFLTGLLFGLAPAIGATRMNIVETLKEGGQRSGGGAAVPRIRNLLLIAQIAMALVLVIAAGLLVRTFYSMLRSSPGFDATHVATFELSLPTPKYADTARMTQLYQQVLQRLQSVAEIKNAGFASVVPMDGAPDGTIIRIPERPATNPSEQPYANYSFASPDYFATIGTPLLRGRDFSDSDTLKAIPVTIINAAMANKYFHGENPIGKQVGVGMTRIPARTIIGIVANMKHGSLREDPEPEMFVPYTQNEIKVWPSMQSMQFVVSTKSSPSLIAESIGQAVHAVDPDLPVAKFAPLTTLVDQSMIADRFSMLLVSSFGILALILASIGMYGVISWSVMSAGAKIGHSAPRERSIAAE